jgi:transposase
MTNEVVWAERVEEFQRSGRTAAAFVHGRGYTVSALKYWERKLKATAPRALSLARVVRPGTVVEPTFDGAVELLVGSARVVVRRGFDPVLVRELLAALGGPQ